MSDAPQFDARLRLILVTDGVGDPGRIEQIVRAAIRGGVRCVQLREPKWSARQMLRACETVRPMLEQVDGHLLVNDRVDVVAAGVAHGAQIGHRSLPPELARKVLGPDRLLGYSAHDADELASAAKHGCNFALLSPVWPTTSKPAAAFLSVVRAGWIAPPPPRSRKCRQPSDPSGSQCAAPSCSPKTRRARLLSCCSPGQSSRFARSALWIPELTT
jgi:thiamine-phosphate diphosphorylase